MSTQHLLQQSEENPVLDAQSPIPLGDVPVEGPPLVKFSSESRSQISEFPVEDLVVALVRGTSQVAEGPEEVTTVAETSPENGETIETVVITHRVALSRQLLQLSVGELFVLCSFLSRRDLCHMSQVCSHLRHASSTDELWRPVVAKALFVGSFDRLADMFPSIALDIPKMGVKAAFNKFKTPPLVPADKFVWGDVLVVVFVSLNTADFLTDLLMLVAFAEQQEWLYFWLCLPFLLLYPFILLTFERQFQSSHSAGAWVVNIILTVLQLRVFVEAANYYKERWNRYKLSGEVLARVKYRMGKLQTQTQARSSNVTIIKSFEAAFESVPQSLLQTFIVVGLGRADVLSVFSVAVSLVSVSLGFASLSKPRPEESRHPLMYGCVLVFMFTGLAVRMVGFSMFIATVGTQGLYALLVVFALNLIAGCSLQTVKRHYIPWMPVFAFLTSLVPVTFYPHETNWYVFNSGLFAINWCAAVSLTATSLVLDTSQEAWTAKLTFQAICAGLLGLSFAVLLLKKVQILNPRG